MNRRHFIAAASLITAAASLSGVALAQDYGKPGGPVKLVVGYQPYYTQSWSGVVMRGKKFYEKYLPKGSKVEFQIGLQGAIIVNNMLAGKQHIGYMGDMPAIVSTTKTEVADVRLVANLGLAYDQCNAFLVRNDAPQFKNDQEAIKWLDGKTVAVPKGSCTDRFAQATFKQLEHPAQGVPEPEHRGDHLQFPRRQARRGGDVGADHLAPGGGGPRAPGRHRQERAGERRRLPRDARGPDQGAARRGQGVAEGRARRAALHRRPEERGRGDQDGEGADHRLLGEGAVELALRHAIPTAPAAATMRNTMHYTFTPEARELINRAAAFLHSIKSINTEKIRPEAIESKWTEEILKERGLKAPIGEVKALPASQAPK